MRLHLHNLAAKLVLAIVLISACISAFAQERLRGTAVIQDSFSQSRVTFADLFYVLRIEENAQITSLDVTIDATLGRALQAIPRVLSTLAPAGRVTLTIVGERHYVNEIIADTQPRMRVQGEVTVQLDERLTYTVRGSMAPVCCEVWLEDDRGNEVPGTWSSQPPLPAKRPR